MELSQTWQEQQASQSNGADFRSDTVTQPTPEMLRTVFEVSPTDIFNEKPSSFEQYMARVTGKEDALLCISGTMANQIALRSHLTQPPMAILADERSHILTMECGGIASLAGAMVQPVRASNGVHLTLEDIRRSIVLDDPDDIYGCPTRVVEFENPHMGAVFPLHDMQAISEFVRPLGIRVHLDGARLWEAVVAGAGTLEEMCGPADSVSLCFTKGLCAPIGSILVGNAAFIRQARKVRKGIGGAMRQPGMAIAMAMGGVVGVFGQAEGHGSESMLLKGHRLARELAHVWTGAGGKVTMPVQTNMVCLNLDALGISEEDWVNGGAERGLMLRESKIVTHCQIEPNAVMALKQYMIDTLAKTKEVAHHHSF
ncbi:l-allo-threonine aldolase [Coniochaeta sp. 2T2.1]|nr:l-allo-threonine aldolase [Coniochaeta sp. 2T2.1]